MKKRIMAALLVLCMAFSLTGCVDTYVSQKVTKDGIVNETMNICINKQAYFNYMREVLGSVSDSDISAMESELLKDGYQLQNINGTDYYVNTNASEQITQTIAKSTKSSQKESVHGEIQLWETGAVLNFNFFAKELGTEIDEGEYSKKELAAMTKMMDSCFIIYSVEFDYDIAETDPLAVIDSANPKKASWKVSFSNLEKTTIYARCNSDIAVSGVTQGATYKNSVTLHYEGAVSAVYNGNNIANDTTFGTHGQHTVVLTSASGEQRTVTFFIDKNKPVIKKLKNNKTYKKGKLFRVVDKDSGIASVTVNGKKAKEASAGTYKLTKKGKNRIVVKDAVGNVKKMTVKVK